MRFDSKSLLTKSWRNANSHLTSFEGTENGATLIETYGDSVCHNFTRCFGVVCCCKTESLLSTLCSVEFGENWKLAAQSTVKYRDGRRAHQREPERLSHGPGLI